MKFTNTKSFAVTVAGAVVEPGETIGGDAVETTPAEPESTTKPRKRAAKAEEAES